jgi:hypothetical protein
MKKLILSIATFSILLTACNSVNEENLIPEPNSEKSTIIYTILNFYKYAAKNDIENMSKYCTKAVVQDYVFLNAQEKFKNIHISDVSFMDTTMWQKKSIDSDYTEYYVPCKVKGERKNFLLKIVDGQWKVMSFFVFVENREKNN